VCAFNHGGGENLLDFMNKVISDHIQGYYRLGETRETLLGAVHIRTALIQDVSASWVTTA
jgi:hypothetical protein